MNVDLAANSAENRYQYFRMLPFGTVTNLCVMINDFLHSCHADKWTSRMPTTKNHGVIFVVRTKVNKYWYIFHSKGSNRMIAVADDWTAAKWRWEHATNRLQRATWEKKRIYISIFYLRDWKALSSNLTSIHWKLKPDTLAQHKKATWKYI